jgi:hypothetical protein
MAKKVADFVRVSIGIKELDNLKCFLVTEMATPSQTPLDGSWSKSYRTLFIRH